MRRGWLLILGLVTLLIAGAGAWWWSTPGQLWWLRYKADREIPPLVNRPGGWDPIAAETVIPHFLDPQASRLISRDVVRWYARRLPNDLGADKFRRLRDRMEREVTILHPFEWFFDHRDFAPWEENAPVLLIRLMPPDQHAVLARLCREELGTEGEVIDVGNVVLMPLNLLSNLTRHNESESGKAQP